MLNVSKNKDNISQTRNFENAISEDKKFQEDLYANMSIVKKIYQTSKKK